ncbi:hypothetical protein Huta_1127 [Halorhabdus utahensis DSM 12940]|uniref:Glycosyltransferase RgtA/B/C/D-like domain-containing protein n=1 Tax=Halorhabdus utahensis (strain DSM 12940 / JCM 11049 / AX-2) TaxID=519442 RepID=C7NM96_HALUD|nr:glycosyltransferase family 39 protein [Halorhabdus utahensis]ACV11304.1 hypothetical protein Huta_1127 [Halorhabdus utahensis DSM 12940]
MALLAVVFALIVLLLVTRYTDLPWYRPAALVAFLGHVFVALVVLPRLPYRWDIAQFHQTASEIATGSFTSGSSTVSSFGGFQALTYTVFSPQPETIAIFSGLFAVLTVIPISSLVRQLYPSRTESRLGLVLIVLFAPLQFLFLSLPMRDGLSVLLFFSLLSVALRALKTHQLRSVAVAIPLWGMLYLLRPELALVFVLGSLANVIVKVVQTTTDDLSLTSLTAVIGTAGAIGFGLFAEVLYSFESANAQMTGRSSGGAVYLDGMEYASWFDFLLAAPVRAIYFQFAPFPLHVESIFHFLAFTVSVAVIVLTVAAARSLYECRLDETTAVFLVVIYFAGIVGYGTINANFGTNVRHRIVFDFLLLGFALPVIQHWELHIREWLGIIPRQRRKRDEKKRET